MELTKETIYLCNRQTGVVKELTGWRIPENVRNGDGSELTEKQKADRQKNWYVEEGSGGYVYNNKSERAYSIVCEDLETAIYWCREWCSETRRRVMTAYSWMADNAARPPKPTVVRQKREGA